MISQTSLTIFLPHDDVQNQIIREEEMVMEAYRYGIKRIYILII